MAQLLATPRTLLCFHTRENSHVPPCMISLGKKVRKCSQNLGGFPPPYTAHRDMPDTQVFSVPFWQRSFSVLLLSLPCSRHLRAARVQSLLCPSTAPVRSAAQRPSPGLSCNRIGEELNKYFSAAIIAGPCTCRNI